MFLLFHLLFALWEYLIFKMFSFILRIEKSYHFCRLVKLYLCVHVIFLTRTFCQNIQNNLWTPGRFWQWKHLSAVLEKKILFYLKTRAAPLVSCHCPHLNNDTVLLSARKTTNFILKSANTTRSVADSIFEAFSPMQACHISTVTLTLLSTFFKADNTVRWQHS